MNTSRAALDAVDPIGPMTQDGYANRLLRRALAHTSVTALYEPPCFQAWCYVQRGIERTARDVLMLSTGSCIDDGPIVLDVTP